MLPVLDVDVHRWPSGSASACRTGPPRSRPQLADKSHFMLLVAHAESQETPDLPTTHSPAGGRALMLHLQSRRFREDVVSLAEQLPWSEDVVE